MLLSQCNHPPVHRQASPTHCALVLLLRTGARQPEMMRRRARENRSGGRALGLINSRYEKDGTTRRHSGLELALALVEERVPCPIRSDRGLPLWLTC